MIYFKYNKKIDTDCWEKIIMAGEMFGHEFPKDYAISEEMISQANNAARQFEKKWKEADIDLQQGMIKIFGKKVPDLVCYINTSRYSMDNYPMYISVSMLRADPVASILHELSHYMFRECFSDIPNIENVKEIVTVINNDVFGVNDYGWKAHQKERDKALAIWKKTENIEEVLKDINQAI